MTRRKITSGHWPAPLRLYFDDGELFAITRCDVDRVRSNADDRAWLKLWRAARTFQVRERAPHDQPRTVEKRVGVRPRIEPAHSIVNRQRRLRPVDQPLFLR